MKTIKIHGDDWDLDYILTMLEDVRRDDLRPAKWQPRDALVRLDGSRATAYTGQPFDPAQYEIKPGVWNHDHCQVCWWRLEASDDPDQAEGYTDGDGWICKECHRRFIEGHELDGEIKQPQQSPAAHLGGRAGAPSGSAEG